MPDVFQWHSPDAPDEKPDSLPKKVDTTANVHLGKGDKGFKITLIELVTKAEVPGIDNIKFQEIAAAAKVGCPVSQALAATEIKLDAKLV